MRTANNYEPIAIVGYSCIYPENANTNDKFWNMIVNGDVHIDEIPEERWKWEYYYSRDKTKEDKTYSKLGACCPKNVNLSKKFVDKYSIDDLNRTQIMALETILMSIENSGMDIAEIKSDKAGYYMGNMLGDDLYPDYSLRMHLEEITAYLNDCEEFKVLDTIVKKQILDDLTLEVDKKYKVLDKKYPEKYINSALPYTIKKLLGLSGLSVLMDGACSSSILVIDEAVKMIHNKELDICFVTGVLGSVNVIGSVGFSKIGGLSDERSRPLDKQAKGLNASEGVGTIIIKTLKKAIEDNNKIYGVIAGTGVSNDGKGKSIYAPNRTGQYKAMKRALDYAEILPTQIDYIEVHATGTPTGDIEELETLKLLFKEYDVEKHTIPIGSIKSQIGHSFSAAGMANLIKVIEGIKHETIPPTWGFDGAPEEVNMDDSPFYVNTALAKWNKKENEPRRAVVNAFGFGGVNASLVLEEYSEEYHKTVITKNLTKVSSENTDISIVGIGVIDSKAGTRSEWFDKIEEKYVSQSVYPPKRWSESYSNIFSRYLREGCFIEEYKFPFLKFKIPPKTLQQIDRAQPLSLMAASEALEDYGIDKINHENVAVYVGKQMNSESAAIFNTSVRYLEFIEFLKKIKTFQQLKEETQISIFAYLKSKIREYAPAMTEDALPGYMDNIVSGRISNCYDFDGSSAVIDSGRNSFTVALKHGIDNLLNEKSQIVLVGGVQANMTPEFLNVFYVYSNKIGKLQNSVPSEGSVFFVLKRTCDVVESDKVYARITGVHDIDLENYKHELPYALNHMFTQSGKEMNYFGAQMGFCLLDAIYQINASDKGFSVLCDGFIGNSYVVNIIKPNFHDSMKGSMTLFIEADTHEELYKKIDKIISGEKYKMAHEDKMDKKFKLAIVYSSEKELITKLELLKKIDSGEKNERLK